MKKQRPYVVTFPRSGSHYFDRVFYKETKLRIETSHAVNWLFDKDNNKQRTIITIIRDPKDSIASYIAYEENKLKDSGWHVDDNRINQIITEYILLYSFLYENAEHVIDFNDLIAHPEYTTKKILALLDIKEKDIHLFDGYFGDEDAFFIESSKNLPSYNKDILNSFNVDACYFYYNRLLTKKIVV